MLDREFPYKVESWTDDGQHLTQTIAKVAHATVARAAFQSACVQYPSAWLTLRFGASVLNERAASPPSSPANPG